MLLVELKLSVLAPSEWLKSHYFPQGVFQGCLRSHFHVQVTHLLDLESDFAGQRPSRVVSSGVDSAGEVANIFSKLYACCLSKQPRDLVTRVAMPARVKG